MIEIKPAELSQLEHIYNLLETFNNPNAHREDWQRLLTTHWSKERQDFGYVMLDNQQVVGFIGTLFSERLVEGKLYKFCNLVTWIVKEEYRASSLMLFLKAISTLKDYTLLAATPVKAVGQIYQKFKFQELESTLKIIVTFPVPQRLFGYKISADLAFLTTQLNQRDLRLFQDHQIPLCQHALIYNQHEYCYVVFNKVKKKKLFFTQVCYISHPALFAKALSRIQLFFLRKNRTFLILVDQRLLKGSTAGIQLSYKLKTPRRFRSAELKAEQIDNLYTELLLMR